MMKKLISLFLTIVTITMCIILVSCGPKDTSAENLSYSDVLDVCCDAINNRDKQIIEDFIYDGFGSEWNTEMVLNSIDNFYEEYLPLENSVENYETYESESDLKDLQDYIFSETGQIIDIEKGMEIGMNNDSCIEIFLVVIENRWYILYLDL